MMASHPSLEELTVRDMRRAAMFGQFLDSLTAPRPVTIHQPPALTVATKKERKRQHRDAVMAELRLRDAGCCWLCGKPVPVDQESIEHLTPLSRGGANDLANFALAHRRCNQMMGNLRLTEKEELRARFRRGAPETGR